MQGVLFFIAACHCRWRGDAVPLRKERFGFGQDTCFGRCAHDGVRPFVAREVIARCYDLAAEKKAVIPVIGVVETVRRMEGESSVTVGRDDYRLVQTPQVFDAELLKAAYEQPYTPHFTDDASVVEALGVSVFLTPGNRENIKITTPFDLKIATALIGSCSI